MRREGRFAALALASVVVAGALLAAIFRGPGDLRAIVVSAVVAITVQMLTFLAVRSADPKRLLTAWGVGAFVRLLTLVVYGLLMLRPFGLPPTAALLSLASFFFITTLIESRLLAS